MISASEKKFLDTYKKQFQPKRKYILAHGLAFGLVMIIMQSAHKYLIEKELFAFQNMLFEIIVWLTGGFCYGCIMYWFLSRKLKKIEKKLSNS